MEKRVLIIGGPTGSGETTITSEIEKRQPIFKRLVTATSRQIRSGEKPGVHYYYFSKAEFEKEIANGNVMEHTFIKGRDTYYGSYKPDFEKKIKDGYNIIVNTNIVGVDYYRKQFNATSIFLIPGSIEDLRGRLKKRNPEITEEELEKRMEEAAKEVEREKSSYDYTVVNADGKLEEAVSEIISILQKEGYKLS